MKEFPTLASIYILQMVKIDQICHFGQFNIEGTSVVYLIKIEDTSAVYLNKRLLRLF